MTNPEQVLQPYLKDNNLPQQQEQDNAGQKFLSNAYEKGDSTGCAVRPAGDAHDKGHSKDGAGNNPEKHSDNKPDFKHYPEMTTDSKTSVTLEKEGNVDFLGLPDGFSRGSADRTQNFLKFNSSANKDTQVCYWRRGDFSADDEDSRRIDEVLKKPPHALNEQEILDVMPLMMPGRPWDNGNYKGLCLRTENIDGRRVLLADFRFNDHDKRVHLIIANQDKDRHQIENIWLEGSTRNFDNNSKAVLEAFQQIKWTAAPRKE